MSKFCAVCVVVACSICAEQDGLDHAVVSGVSMCTSVTVGVGQDKTRC